ncbi:peptidase C14 caspase catalytic subunit p20 (plasmid) [Rhizobium leguminosarum bv. trifolii WSM1325]|uniref:Peptidase C14 caspase catalytic subunit p20 n=1 Tax=Rhizobium leguminosarum bv. trifolii (strain WSM1325) TaxID=395491 RepID=C6BB54_RHILS|nr:caspase family protein [Rhizobium leguminosarum]ACS61312.1 peptidase C14 caspase catalytic subunit p20 [Rhizobium leguminosarum bv. trifolii WSM1325]
MKQQTGLCVFLLIVLLLGLFLRPGLAADDRPLAYLPISHLKQIVGAGRIAGTGLIVTAGTDGRVKTWEAATGLLISEYVTPGAMAVAGLAVDPSNSENVAIAVINDNSAYATLVGGDADIQILDLSNNRIVRSFRGQAGRLVFSPHGRWLTSAAYSLLSIWDAETGTLEATIEIQDGSMQAAFADDDTLVFRRNGAVVLLNLLTGQTRSFASSAKGVLAVSQDRKLLAEVGDREVVVRQLPDGTVVGSQPLMNSPEFIYFAEDGAVVAGGHFSSTFVGQNMIYRLNPGDWTLKTYTAGHSPLTLMADGGDSALLGQANGRIQRVDFKAPVRLDDLGQEADAITALGFSATGRYLAAGLEGGGALIWEPTSNFYRVLDPLNVVTTPPELGFSDVEQQKHVSATYRTGEGQTKSPEINKDGIVGLAFVGTEALMLVHKSGKAEIVNVTTGTVLRSFSVDSPNAVVSSGSVAVIHSYHNITVVMAETFETRQIALGNVSAISVAIKPQGDHVVVRGFEGTADVDLMTGIITPLSTKTEGVPVFRAGGDMATLSWSSPISVTPPEGAGGNNDLVAWRRDLSLGVLAQRTGAVRIWSGEQSTPLEFYAGGAISSIAVSPDGVTVAIGSNNGRIAFHRISDGHAKGELLGADRRGWLVKSSDGYFDGSYAAWANIRGTRASTRLSAEEPSVLFDTWFRPQLLSLIIADGAVDAAAPRSPALSARPPSVQIISPVSNYLRDAAPPMSTTSSLVSDERVDASGKQITWEVIAPNRQNSQVIGQKIGEDANVDLVSEVADLGDGVQECRVFRNRRLVASSRPILNAGKAQFSSKIPLSDGDNVLSVYCFSNSGLRSQEAELHIYGSDSLRRDRTAFVVVVGIDSYQEGYKLRYAKADARLAAAKLEATLKSTGNYTRIVPVSLLDEQATASTILSGLQILAGSREPVASGPLSGLLASTPSDAVFFFFAGHGGGFAGDYRLIASDGLVGSDKTEGTVSASALRDVLTPLKADRTVLIIDACESGQTLDKLDKRAGPLAGRSLAQLAYDKAMFLISASQSRQSARELQRLGHGLFSYVLFEPGLGPQADDNKDGYVTIGEWLSFAQIQSPKEQDQEREMASMPVPAITYEEDAKRSTFFDEVENVAQTPRLFIPDPVLAREFVIVKTQGTQP